MKQYRDTNYSVTEDGCIINNKTGRNMKICVNRGYQVVSIYINKKRFTTKVHRIIAECYLDNPSNYDYVNHKDGNKLNNNLSNLEWCTHKHNMQHAYNTGLNKGRQRKLTKDNCSDIIEAYNAGINQATIAKHYSVSQCIISEVINSKYHGS